MPVIKNIIKVSQEDVTIKLPKEFLNKTVEITVKSMNSPDDRIQKIYSIFKEANGMLPPDYSFSRDQANER